MYSSNTQSYINNMYIETYLNWIRMMLFLYLSHGNLNLKLGIIRPGNDTSDRERERESILVLYAFINHKGSPFDSSLSCDKSIVPIYIHCDSFSWYNFFFKVGKSTQTKHSSDKHSKRMRQSFRRLTAASYDAADSQRY